MNNLHFGAALSHLVMFESPAAMLDASSEWRKGGRSRIGRDEWGMTIHPMPKESTWFWALSPWFCYLWSDRCPPLTYLISRRSSQHGFSLRRTRLPPGHVEPPSEESNSHLQFCWSRFCLGQCENGPAWIVFRLCFVFNLKGIQELTSKPSTTNFWAMNSAQTLPLDQLTDSNTFMVGPFY